MLTGGITVFVWKFLFKPMGDVFEVHELLPDFIFSYITIVAFYLIDKAPSEVIGKESYWQKGSKKEKV